MAEFSGQGSATFLMRLFQTGGLRLFLPVGSTPQTPADPDRRASLGELAHHHDAVSSPAPDVAAGGWGRFSSGARALEGAASRLTGFTAPPPENARYGTNSFQTGEAEKAWPANGLAVGEHPAARARERSFLKHAASLLPARTQASFADGSPSHPGQRYGEAAACEAVLVNTAGGIAGGDSARLCFIAGPMSHAVLTTQAQEKIYRSDGPPARIELDVTLHAQARFEWLPQETILFHQAKLHRQLRVEMAADSTLLLVESQIFGRLASGETHIMGGLRETWRILRAGKLIFAEELRLEGDIAEKLDRKALGGKARAIGTLLLAAPDAEAHLEMFRAALPPSPEGLHRAASAWNGMLLARFAAVSPELLRGAMIAALSVLRGRALPRVWQV